MADTKLDLTTPCNASWSNKTSIADAAPQVAGLPEGWVAVPIVPTEEQWGGLARDIIMWHDMNESGKRTPRALFKHLEMLGRDIPQWLRDEQEMRNLDHVPSKGTRAAIIYRAMVEDAAAPPAGQAQDPTTDELAMLIGRLANALRKAAPDHALPDQAIDYLKRKGIAGSPLRAGQAQEQEKDAARLHYLVRLVIRDKTGCELSEITDDLVATFLEPIDAALSQSAGEAG